jgi:hypothetical protein
VELVVKHGNRYPRSNYRPATERDSPHKAQ